ncbi:MAG: transporter [Betaproteobacteria bacterium HGW-Betaproteobacteria-11]|nr:MAG: transporter [Betaproteobacteria bacterium HGW-Betaproteobacteria-11]
MKPFLLLTAALVVCSTLLVTDAEARRLGGARSFGMSRDSSVINRQATAPRPAAPIQNTKPGQAANPAPLAPQPGGMSRWLGPLAGLAAGVGLAALLSHFGLGEAMADFLLIALAVMAVMFVLRLLLRKREAAPGMQLATADGLSRFQPSPYPSEKLGAGETAIAAGSQPAGERSPIQNSAEEGMPADFDSEGFLRQAKLNFVRLQAANDAGNMEDIRQFTTPEVAAEIQLQYQERGKLPQQTDVMQIDARLLDLSTVADRYVASVHFSGQLREAANAAAENFAEVWHLVKPVDGSHGWLVAGIQQP